MLTNALLKYHCHARQGWQNDPNGLCFFKGQYHLFFQHAPHYEIPWGESMYWGHCATKDFLHFDELPVAFGPDREYDEKGAWSGTAIEKDGVLYAYYASVDGSGKQTISLATSEDGIHFQKYERNPIISDIPAEGSQDFRDPAILRGKDGNYLVIASGDPKKSTGNLLLYRANDMVSWTYSGVLLEYKDCKFCECPSFVPAGDHFLISVSVVRNDGSHYFEVLCGDFDGHTFSPICVSHFQKGPDEYAGQIFHAPDGRNIMISWIPGWQYQPPEKCIGCMSIPLEISFDGNDILAYPVHELRHLIDPQTESITDAYIRETYRNHGREVVIELLEKPGQ